MAIIPFPRDMLASIRWQQQGGRPQVQRSVFTGRATQLDFGPAARWVAQGDPVPMWDDSQRQAWSGFEAACQVPGNTFRLPAVERSQYASAGILDTLVANGDFANGVSPWLPTGGFWQTERLAHSDGAPASTALVVGVGTGSLQANNNVRTPVSVMPNGTLWLSAWVRASFTGTLSLQIYWFNSGGTFISNAGLSLAPTTPNVWEHRQASVTIPSGAATFMPQFDGALSAGFAQVTNARVSSYPWRALAAASSAGRTLNLSGLGPGIPHLLAGQLLTVVLPDGDEQLVRLAAPLVADGGGLAAASLATPLRRAPTVGALVYLAEPHGLMRAAHTPGWGVDSQNVYGHDFQAEEAF